MICKHYAEMDDIARMEFNARLLHCAQHSDYGFILCQAVINKMEEDGIFKGVKIGREVHQEELPPTLAYRKTDHDEHTSE